MQNAIESGQILEGWAEQSSISLLPLLQGWRRRSKKLKL